LGFCSPDYLPTNRGFDSFSGFLLGAADHYDHNLGNPIIPPAIPPAYHFYKNEEPDFSVLGQYSAVR